MGWHATDTTYSDAEVSGAVLERPGLRRLMAAIAARKIDVAVVYKLDRISRSVVDFTQMMAFFDQHKVSLVSVSQHLNSGDSLGRLAINTLMSFTEFERDIASERKLDKFISTRRRGLWSGRVAPLGYVLQSQRLVIKEDEAKLARTIFEWFVALQSVTLMAQELTERGATAKSWMTRNGKVRGGKPIDKVYIYKLLTNRMLIGELPYDDAWHPAEHESIIHRDLWEQAQALLSARRRPGKLTPLVVVDNELLLRGLVFGEDGRAYSPWTSSVRGNRVYRYYVPQKDIAQGSGTSGMPRLQAFALEQQVMDHVLAHLKNPDRVLALLPEWLTQHPEYSEAQFSEALTRIAQVWPELFPGFQKQIARRVLDRVTVHSDRITVRLHVEGFVELIREFLTSNTLPSTVRGIFDRAATNKPCKPRR